MINTLDPYMQCTRNKIEIQFLVKRARAIERLVLIDTRKCNSYPGEEKIAAILADRFNCETAIYIDRAFYWF